MHVIRLTPQPGYHKATCTTKTGTYTKEVKTLPTPTPTYKWSTVCNPHHGIEYTIGTNDYETYEAVLPDGSTLTGKGVSSLNIHVRSYIEEMVAQASKAPKRERKKRVPEPYQFTEQEDAELVKVKEAASDW